MIKPKYYLSQNNGSVIENYNSSPTFSSFFPGIAGVFGTPMWVFYANRGQCISSFGVHDKDGAIMEFEPANKAYKSVALNGFRTFIKCGGKFWEPFSETSDTSQMDISSYDLKLTDVNRSLGLKIEVEYFTVPNESFAALARRVKITNMTIKTVNMEIIDGMPAIIPFGFSNGLLKNMSRTIEAWCIVENLEHGVPFYKLKVMPSDVPETETFKKGNFYISFASINGKESPVSFLINPASVFGEVTSLQIPENFISQKNFKVPIDGPKEGFLPSAFSYKKAVLPVNGTLEIVSFIGHAEEAKEANRIRTKVSKMRYVTSKSAENKGIINDVASNVETNSAFNTFDRYSKQSFLDNVMRGGLPITVGNKAFYCFYRKHGDMERDYNDFKVIPSYLSQGNGNYRDINQNRRNDLFFNTLVDSSNIKHFFNMSQLDGFNPLEIMADLYVIDDVEKARVILKDHLKVFTEELSDLLTKPFILGAVLRILEEYGFKFSTAKEKFVEDLLDNSRKIEEAVHEEGFWTDHFTYNCDLLESYEAIFPEKMNDILFDQKIFTYFDNDHIVCERKDKYFLKNGIVRQFKSVKVDQEKRSFIESRTDGKHITRINNGTGDIYRSSLAAKLLIIIANKAASLDAEGIGIEMEAGKPNWYDALNGLPALFGSSISETFELKRLAKFLLDRTKDSNKISIPLEVKEFLDGVSSEAAYFKSTGDAFVYWDNTYTLKEAYRRRTKLGISGSEVTVDSGYIREVLGNIISKCSLGVSKCLKKYGTYCTYFTNEALEYETIQGTSNVKIKMFRQSPLPLFLEGFVHALKVEKDLNIYNMVKKSPLFDKKLKMYKVNAPLKDASLEIGRTKVFAPGWLENESIWLHMEYKYLLELLKAGQYKEFFADMKNILVPFMDPKVYKRSVLENSSFIVSSANPDPELHGRGFVARLSGATAEFLDMWITMTSGKKIFTLDAAGKLIFKLSPILPSWMFKNGIFSFKLLGSIHVTYICKVKKNTYDGISPVSYKLTIDQKEIEIKNPEISGQYASLIRDRKVKRIIVTLG